jgi:hypothetical protein
VDFTRLARLLLPQLFSSDQKTNVLCYDSQDFFTSTGCIQIFDPCAARTLSMAIFPSFSQFLSLFSTSSRFSCC